MSLLQISKGIKGSGLIGSLLEANSETQPIGYVVSNKEFEKNYVSSVFKTVKLIINNVMWVGQRIKEKMSHNRALL